MAWCGHAGKVDPDSTAPEATTGASRATCSSNCRIHGRLLVVDNAHAISVQTTLDRSDLGPLVYISGFHSLTLSLFPSFQAGQET